MQDEQADIGLPGRFQMDSEKRTNHAMSDIVEVGVLFQYVREPGYAARFLEMMRVKPAVVLRVLSHSAERRHYSAPPKRVTFVQVSRKRLSLVCTRA